MRNNILTLIFSTISFLCFAQSYVIFPKIGKSIEPEKVRVEKKGILIYTMQNSVGEISFDEIKTVFKNGKEISIQEFEKEIETAEKLKDKPPVVKNETPKEAPKEIPKEKKKIVEKELISKQNNYSNSSSQLSTSQNLSTTSATNTQPQVSNSVFTVFEEIELMVINFGLGSATWVEAKNMCKELNRGGFNDWYLPSKNELEVIFNIKDITFIERLTSTWFWTSTEKDKREAYNVKKVNLKLNKNGIIENAWVSGEDKKSDGPDCLCVRKIK